MVRMMLGLDAECRACVVRDQTRMVWVADDRIILRGKQLRGAVRETAGLLPDVYGSARLMVKTLGHVVYECKVARVYDRISLAGVRNHLRRAGCRTTVAAMSDIKGMFNEKNQRHINSEGVSRPSV